MAEQYANMLTGHQRTNDQGVGLYTILAPGFAKWWGSDARALRQALRRLGHIVLELDEEDYMPWRPQGVGSKVVRRIFGGIGRDDYNQAVLRQASSCFYDFILSFKGNSLKPQTIAKLRVTGKPIYNFYPDVSFQDHGPNIPLSLKLYDCVFTTKSFHGEREIKLHGIRDLQHVRHGFDPEVHRPVALTSELEKHYGADVSFVGCWSPEKEARLLYLIKECPEISVKVYGMGWNYSSNDFKQRLGRNLKAGVFGDELSLVYCASKINLGLLSVSTSDASLRDQTTARTFQIPATGSFMLHEDTAEVRKFFEDGKEVMLFSNNEEMVEKIRLALSSPRIRVDVRQRGYERCLREPYDYGSAARDILSYFESKTKQSGLDNALVIEKSKDLTGSSIEEMVYSTTGRSNQ